MRMNTVSKAKEWNSQYWLDSIRVPVPVADEALVQTITPLGQTTGYFCWPRRDLDRFRRMNADRHCPLYFAWNDSNDMSKTVSSEKLES